MGFQWTCAGKVGYVLSRSLYTLSVLKYNSFKTKYTFINKLMNVVCIYMSIFIILRMNVFNLDNTEEVLRSLFVLYILKKS